MSPKPADPDVRMALVETAADILATDGPARLTIRRLTEAVGTSTMAVYTHFGGMDELRREVRREGFQRLGAYLGAVEESEDPVADLGRQGRAYYFNAVQNPNLYRAMFFDGPMVADEVAIDVETFEFLVGSIQRCIDAGRFNPVAGSGAVELATQLWALTHGIVALELAHMLGQDDALGALGGAARSLFAGFGDSPADTAASLADLFAAPGSEE